MKRFRLDDTEDHLTEEGVANGPKLVPSGTVLLLARGMTLLNDLPICVVKRAMTFNQDVKALRPKPGVCNEFLPYLLLGNKDRLLNLVDLAGHGTGRLNSDELKGLDVVLPPECEQRAIANTLGTLDDKIELNRRMNETLEAMARALFKSWFVDFDPVRAKAEGRDPGLPKPFADLFPDSFEDSELGEIRRGGTSRDSLTPSRSLGAERRRPRWPSTGTATSRGSRSLMHRLARTFGSWRPRKGSPKKGSRVHLRGSCPWARQSSPRVGRSAESRWWVFPWP